MMSRQTLHRLADSWYNAKNIEGKKGGCIIHVGVFRALRSSATMPSATNSEDLCGARRGAPFLQAHLLTFAIGWADARPE